MEFEIEDSFKVKIDMIIEKDLRELFGGDEPSSDSAQRHSIISKTFSKAAVETALPLDLYEIMVSITDIPGDNPYNRLLTAIEMLEKGDEKDDNKVCQEQKL